MLAKEFASIKEKRNKGVGTQENFQIQKNIIISSLLYLIDELKNEDVNI